jgi:asparagine synthase (glutamine-hydrolysing)
MSGIVGVYHLDRQLVESLQLRHMVDVLAHRGPDGSNIWLDGAVGLGQRMLWTTPESLLEQQPLVDKTGSFVLVADLRIDNRQELISALNFAGWPIEKITDSQLVLAAYEKWGEECPKYLLGDFALAIWDQPRRQMFCARDHFGIKPFYYYYQPRKNFYFASEIKAIAFLPEVPRRLNEIAIADYLHPVIEDKSITFYKNIYRLPPGHTLIVSDAQGLRLNSYWSLTIPDELKLGSDGEYAEAFREVFTESVRCRLRSAFPISSHLSGGLDSSSVTCVARDIQQQEKGLPIHTFSSIFPDVPECDERPFIHAVVEQGGLIPHYISADKSGALSEWQEFFQAIDEPFIGPSHFLTWGLNRATQQADIRISLDGFDGDTTVGHGSQYFSELARQGLWSTFITEAQSVSQHFDTSPTAIFHEYGLSYLQELAHQGKWLTFAQTADQISQHWQISRRQLFLSQGVKPLVPQSVRRTWQKLRGYDKPPKNVNSLINSDFAHKMKWDEFTKPQKQLHSSPITVREYQHNTFTSTLFALTLDLVDHSSAAFSIESRHPFMDKRMIEFCLSLPPEQKLNQGWSRMVMRRGMNGILPEKVQWRGGKTDMTPNFLRGLLNFDRELVDEVVVNHQSPIQEFVDFSTLQKSHHRLISQGEKTNDDTINVWKAVTLALWLRSTGLTP